MLRAGLKLIAHKGIAGITLAEVGTMAGFSRGIVAHHFGSKAAFIQALINSIQKDFYENQRRLAPAPAGLQRLLASANLYLSRSSKRSAVMNAMVTESIIHGGELQQDLRAFTSTAASYYGNLIQQAVDKGEASFEEDVEAMSIVLLSLLRGLTATLLLLGDDPRADQVRATAHQAIKRILGATPVKPSTS